MDAGHPAHHDNTGKTNRITPSLISSDTTRNLPARDSNRTTDILSRAVARKNTARATIEKSIRGAPLCAMVGNVVVSLFHNESIIELDRGRTTKTQKLR